MHHAELMRLIAAPNPDPLQQGILELKIKDCNKHLHKNNLDIRELRIRLMQMTCPRTPSPDGTKRLE
jgi:hypothetical protein